MDHIFYLYRITNLLNGKYYLGKRSFKGKMPEDDIKYLGSGKLIRRAIKKYGKESFKKEILSQHKTLKELNEAEATLITEKEINDLMCYNTTLGGHGGYLGGSASDKLRKTQQTPEYRKNMSIALSNPDVKRKISESLRKTMSDPLWKENFSKIQKEAQNRPEEKLRNSLNQKKAQNRPEVKEAKSKRMKIAFTKEETIIKHKESCNTESFKNAQSNKTKDTVWINLDGIQRYVKKDILQEFLDRGWNLGMIKRQDK